MDNQRGHRVEVLSVASTEDLACHPALQVERSCCLYHVSNRFLVPREACVTSCSVLVSVKVVDIQLDRHLHLTFLKGHDRTRLEQKKSI